MYANIVVNRDAGNLNIDEYEPLFKKGIRILQDHKETRLHTRPRRIASILAKNWIIL